MSLPASQQRVLNRMEEALKSREPRLAAMYAMFTRLTTHEALPRREALDLAPWWSPRRWFPAPRHHSPLGPVRAVVIVSLAAAMVVAAVFVGMSQSRGGCNTPIMMRGPLIGMTHVWKCPATPQAKGFGHGP
jgi:hypothetical protein